VFSLLKEQNTIPSLGLRARSHPCYRYYVIRSTRRHVAQTRPDPARYSDPPLLVLASLADGAKHGHVMIEDIARMSGTRLGPGTLYGAIARLERDGLIEPLAPDDRKQPYQLTLTGLQVLRARLGTLRRFTRAALRKLEAQ
jgi:DNA-binding PadR family transcriptional regulator